MSSRKFYNLSSPPYDMMGLNNAITNFDTSSGYYVLKLEDDCVLHTVVNNDCIYTSFPVMFNDNIKIFYPIDVANMYLFKNMDTQMLLTYEKYQGNHDTKYSFGNIDEKYLRLEMYHIIHNKLSNIAAYNINKHSYLIDIHNYANLKKIHDDVIMFFKSSTALPDFMLHALKKCKIDVSNRSHVCSVLIDNFCTVTGYVSTDNHAIKPRTVPITAPSIVRVSDPFSTSEDPIDSQSVGAIHDITHDDIVQQNGGYFARYFKITRHIGTDITIDPTYTRETYKQHIQKKRLKYVKDYIDLKSKFVSVYANHHSGVSILSKRYDTLLSSITANMNAKMSEFKNAQETYDKMVQKMASDPNVRFYIHGMKYDGNTIFRFETANGGFVLLKPVNGKYEVFTYLVISRVHTDKSCEFCVTGTTNTICCSTYNLGITTYLKYYNYYGKSYHPSAVTVENIQGQSLFVDGNDRLLSFPYYHVISQRSTQCKYHPQPFSCGPHTYFYSTKCDDAMLFSAKESLDSALTYAYYKYGKKFTIGPLDYKHNNGIIYAYISTRTPTIYPVIHALGNSMDHVHLHTWVCVKGDKMHDLLEFGKDDTREKNIGKECSDNIFGTKLYATFNNDRRMRDTIMPSRDIEKDPTFDGGPFEYVYKKILGLHNTDPIMCVPFVFKEPRYDLHDGCLIDKKQIFSKKT